MAKKDQIEQIKEAATAALAPYSFIVVTDDESVQYDNILGYQVGGPVVAISMHDGATHVFPLDRIRYMCHFVTPVELRQE